MYLIILTEGQSRIRQANKQKNQYKTIKQIKNNR